MDSSPHTDATRLRISVLAGGCHRQDREGGHPRTSHSICLSFRLVPSGSLVVAGPELSGGHQRDARLKWGCNAIWRYRAEAVGLMRRGIQGEILGGIQGPWVRVRPESLLGPAVGRQTLRTVVRVVSTETWGGASCGASHR